MNNPKIIAIVNPKGGVGKTNLTRTLAHGLTLRGLPAAMGETDPQSSLAEWANLHEHPATRPPVYKLNAATEAMLMADIQTVSQIYEVDNDHSLGAIIVDGCAVEFRLINAAIRAADVVLIPTQSSQDDLIQLGELVSLCEGEIIRRTVKKMPALAVYTIINKAKPGTRLLKETREMLAGSGLPEAGIGLLSAQLRDYEAIRQAAAKGKTVFESGNKNAAADAFQLVDEVLELMQ